MPDLIAQGPSSEDRWRRELPEATSGVDILIGRSEADWNVPWDTMISRAHVRLKTLADSRVRVQCLSTARNAVFHLGKKSSQFTLVPGEHFVIGHTTFTLANRPGASDLSAAGELTEHAYDHSVLRRRHFRDAAARIEVLSRLPDLITGSGSDEELLVRVAGVLLQATPSAAAVAVVAVDGDPIQDEESIQILHYDSRLGGPEGPPVSARLVRSAIHQGDSILHLWPGFRRDASAAYTASEEVDWAFCVPLRSEACPGWALYVTGQLASGPGLNLGKSLQSAPDALQDDVKFAELVGTMIANLQQSRRLERRQAAMRHFFAPVVMEALASRDTDEVLEPREADLCVMFCDLRGFTRRSEKDADQLLKLLAAVSDTLGVMTRHILDTGGVIGDFHGDAAMGFWGWPLEQPDSAIRTATAAMRIRDEIRRRTSEDGFRCGIGIAAGRAVAGRIGTVDQVKVTAFGPVVNLASRLEGATAAFGAEVILDGSTAKAIRQAKDSGFRIRKLALIRPAGFHRSIEIHELLAAPSGDTPSLTDQQIREYEQSLDALLRGDWDEAYERLHALPPWDRPKDTLLATILRHNRVPPDSWNGVIDLPKR
jgi:adenylate cyclase